MVTSMTVVFFCCRCVSLCISREARTALISLTFNVINTVSGIIIFTMLTNMMEYTM